ncbi:MAG: alpha/beta hydrolase [Actinomycetota bacterium]
MKLQRLLTLTALLFACSAPAQAAPETPVVRLWADNAPGEQGAIAPEESTGARVTNVSVPTLTVFAPEKGKATGVAVIIAPGGAYQFHSWEMEGTEIARWFSDRGVTSFVLKYRVPRRSFDPDNKLPLMDAQRAVSLVRSRAKEWGVDPQKIGMLGFSAGGHLAANASNNPDRRAYPVADEIDQVSCRPDFAVLIYPGALLKRDDPSQLAPEMRVSAATPPTFVAVAADDKGCADCSVRYWQAVKAAGVKSELHVYATGGHGFGMRPRAGNAATWPQRTYDWLQGIGILASTK